MTSNIITWTEAFTESQTSFRGFQIVPNKNCSIGAIVKQANSTCTKAYIHDNSGYTLLGTATFSGNTATFSSPISVTSGATYWIEGGSDGVAYTVSSLDSGHTYPDNDTDLSYISDSISGAVHGTGAYNFTDIQTTIVTAAINNITLLRA